MKEQSSVKGSSVASHAKLDRSLDRSLRRPAGTLDPLSSSQQTPGNQAMQRLLQAGAIQARLGIGRPGDRYEQEADRAAEQVMRMPEPRASEEATYSAPQQPAWSGSLKRNGSHSQPEVDEAIRSTGKPLDPATRQHMESYFGHDFSPVRIHADDYAATASDVLGARAYTVGKDIFFGSSQYSPGSTTGTELLAHELAHVVQQSSERNPPQAMPPVSQQDAAHESEAEDVRTSDQTSPTLTLVSPMIQRQERIAVPGWGSTADITDDSWIQWECWAFMWGKTKSGTSSVDINQSPAHWTVNPGDSGYVQISARADYFQDNFLINEEGWWHTEATWMFDVSSGGELTITPAAVKSPSGTGNAKLSVSPQQQNIKKQGNCVLGLSLESTESTVIGGGVTVGGISEGKTGSINATASKSTPSYSAYTKTVQAELVVAEPAPSGPAPPAATPTPAAPAPP